MVLRLSNIVLRWISLEGVIAASHSGFDASMVSNATFSLTMSYELFAKVLELHEQVDNDVPTRLKEHGFPTVFAFSLYVCGSAAAYLRKWPTSCPHLASEAEDLAK